ELIFVVDTSGSMCGRPLDEAKRALAASLARLGREDRFNVFRFDSAASSLYRAPVARTPEAYSRALDYVRDLRASGPTNMTTALRVALEEPVAPGYSRRVVLLTDGGIANETEILAVIRRGLGRARLFTAGFGGAPRAEFLREAAAAGGGRYASIGDSGAAEPKLSAGKSAECAESALASARPARFFRLAGAAAEAEWRRRIAIVLLVGAAACAWLLVGMRSQKR
ncbi:MAG TPA: VWA domain-containing protein, partial [Gammaproteobacteria bacterium]|nr:VWA domain-containing protein [Gammaproteobacteria bacterium]